MDSLPPPPDPKNPPPPKFAKQKKSTHCESTLGVAFANAHANLSTTEPGVLLEIGVSKSSCWLCREFLRTLCLCFPGLRVHVSSCHGKITPGWTLPQGTPAGLARAMEKRVHDEFDEVVARCLVRRRSDSLHFDTTFCGGLGKGHWPIVPHIYTPSPPPPSPPFTVIDSIN